MSALNICEGVAKLLVTTVPGIEDLLLEELQRTSPGSGVVRRGRVIYTLGRALKGGELARLVSMLTLAEKAYAIIVEGRVTGTDDAKKLLLSSLDPIKEWIERPFYFAVEASREGRHDFTSVDIARAVGAALQELLPKSRVSLDDPDVLFYAEIIGEEFRLAIDLTPFVSLRDRGYRAYVHPSSLNPIVARAMCRIAGFRGEQALLDPMCGGGTIVIEALLESPTSRATGFDVDPRHVRGALLNSRAAGVNADFAVADVRSLPRIVRTNVDVIATNPPYGIRERAVGGLTTLYKALIEGGHQVLSEGGRMVILSPLRGKIERIGRRLNWTPSSIRKVEVGGLLAYLFLFEKS